MWSAKLNDIEKLIWLFCFSIANFDTHITRANSLGESGKDLSHPAWLVFKFGTLWYNYNNIHSDEQTLQTRTSSEQLGGVERAPGCMKGARGQARQRAEPEIRYGYSRSGRSPELFGWAVGVRARQNSGQSNSQSRDMGQCIEVCRTSSAAHP